ncbi:hypothetical protein ASPZODRAFT_57688 [Penicilliopsis zonata CBS 506.65]|uniref:Cell wall proline rich protein n=1 Tax=Penicilliopsis zonata CBS 506.65 TaxID=1073090 RepID=A0A1L9SS84_9EURO|nr:hypothetical protein ASPZODRAFT_57688 [Penicilliopsis zonata CBS 506.65]OJJ49957.1 hypothetical protein ASPZODRAFT_57688 [Penicilliopsis zonata CBS 506.65]
MTARLPNPSFVFPARDPDEPKQPLPLPAFSFNPGADLPPQPLGPAPAGHRTMMGHRRRPSELLGGENISESTAQPSAEEPVKLPTPGPGFSAPYRRSHAHRRSAAVSNVDMSIIRQAFEPKPVVGSAPCTPADMRHEHGFADDISRPLSYSATSLSRPSPPSSPLLLPSNRSPSHAKPAFTHHRRPLSTISSETSGSYATTVQLDTVPKENGLPFKPTPNVATEAPKTRPKTADASFTLNFDARQGSRNSRPLSTPGHSRANKSTSGLPELLLKESRFHDGTYLTEEFGRLSSEEECSDVSFELPRESSDSVATLSSKTETTKSKKKQKKVRSWAGAILTRGKGKRHPSNKKDNDDADLPDQSNTPTPIITRTNSDLGSGLDVNFDDDHIIVLRTPTSSNVPEPSPLDVDADGSPSLDSAWKPRSFYEQTIQNDVTSPVIDLDAALGPFNTPDMASDRVVGSGFSAATKRMYSGGRRGEFVGPEMRYHRRAESAPEMPPFDRSFLVSARLKNSSTMSSIADNDVFYEEEEDAFLAAGSESGEADAGSSSSHSHDHEGTPSDAGVAADKESVRSQASSDTLTKQRVRSSSTSRNPGLGIQEQDVADEPSAHPIIAQPFDHKEDDEAQTQTEQQPGPAVDTIITDPRPKRPDAIEIIKQEDWHPKCPGPPSPEVSPRFVPVDKRPSTSPMSFPCNAPHLPPPTGSISPSSSFPSPDFHYASSEAPRSITTPSTSDRNFSNLSYSTDHSPDFPHNSMDDVPSLTSSASTMANTMHRFSATFFGRPRLSSDRAASFSASVNRRTSQGNVTPKRSSLASLSKLVVGTHAERSKLSHEEKPPVNESDPTSKKKGRRISRLMHFWKVKERERSVDTVYQSQQPPPEQRPSK